MGGSTTNLALPGSPALVSSRQTGAELGVGVVVGIADAVDLLADLCSDWFTWSKPVANSPKNGCGDREIGQVSPFEKCTRFASACPRVAPRVICARLIPRRRPDS